MEQRSPSEPQRERPNLGIHVATIIIPRLLTNLLKSFCATVIVSIYELVGVLILWSLRAQQMTLW